MVNLPDFFTSLVATAVKLSSTFLIADPFNSVAVALRNHRCLRLSHNTLHRGCLHRACLGSRSHCVMRQGRTVLNNCGVLRELAKFNRSTDSAFT